MSIVKQHNEQSFRMAHLESLRGLAAFAVVLFHFMVAFYPGALLGRTIEPVDSRVAESISYGLPIGFMVSGHFPVAIFFALSGFVLTQAYFNSRDKKGLQRQAVKRIIRLGVPVFVVVLVSALLIGTGVVASQSLASFNNSPEAARAFNFTPEYWRLLWDATFGVLLAGDAEFNPVLWTMRIELFGSFLVFATAAFLSEFRYRWPVYFVIAAMLWGSYYPCFIAGLALADLLSIPDARRKLSGYINWKTFILGILLVVIFGSYPYAGPALDGGIYGLLQLPGISPSESFILWHSVGAVILLALILLHLPAQKALQGRAMVWLGSVSFGLYLTHYLVIYTLGARLFLAIEPALGYHGAFFATFAITLPTTLVIAWIWTKLVDRPTISFGNRLARI